MAVEILVSEHADSPGGAGALCAALLVGTAALMVMGLQPLLLGALEHEGRLTDPQVGQAATLEIVALALGSALGPRLSRGRVIPLWTFVTCLLLAGANASMYWASSTALIFTLRTVAGALEGLALSSVILIFTHSRQPDRISGIFLAVQTLPQMIAAYLLPVSGTGANGGFLLLAGCAFFASFASWGLTDSVRALQTRRAAPVVWLPGIIITFAAIVLQNAGIAGSWNYVELLADQRRFAGNTLGEAVAGMLACQILGSALVAWTGRRAPFRLALIASSLVQSLLIVALDQLTSPGAFVLFACLFGFLWLAVQPFQIRQLIDLDSTRGAALLVVPLTLAGASLGPLGVSFVVAASGVDGAFWVSAGLLLLSTLLYAISCAREVGDPR